MKNISILVIKADEYAYIDVLNYLKRKEKPKESLPRLSRLFS